MRIDISSFRGEAPRLTPRALPLNGAQLAKNARLQSGDLEAWRQFALNYTLANVDDVQTIYLLNGEWLSWTVDADVARGIIPGDDTYRVYITAPDLYDQPRWTNFSLATGGAEPYPSTTRPLGVPNPDSAPSLEAGVSTAPTSTTTEVSDSGDELDTAWNTNPPVSGGFTTATVTQDASVGNGAPSYRLDADENINSPAWLSRDFGVSDSQVVRFSVDFRLSSGGGPDARRMLVNMLATSTGTGIFAYWSENGVLAVGIAPGWTAIGIAALDGTFVGVPSLDTFYTLDVQIVRNTDGSRTVTAGVYLGSAQVGTSVVVTNAFINTGGYFGAILHVGDDATSTFKAYYDNWHVIGTSPTDALTQTATSYVYTFVNDIGEESGPSPASATILKDDSVAITVTTPTAVQSGFSADYSVQTKRIYRAVTGNTGTVFRFVAEIPLATADYVDELTDSELGDVLETEDWDLPPDDLKGILALPNGIMAGFRRNQLCLSAQNRPHAWPVKYRLNTDTDIVAIGNIDNTVVIGTEAFPYVATGNDPSAYSMGKLEVPQACVSKRSLAYLKDIGVVFASPDGLIAISGNGRVTILTESVFTRKQWQALNPESILGVAHDDVYHFFYDGEASFLTIDNASGQAADGSTFTLTVTRTGSTSVVSTVDWAATGDLFDGSTGFERVEYSGTLTFGIGETTATLSFTLQTTGTEDSFSAQVVLSDPSAGTTIVDGTGTLTASAYDPDFASVGYLLHLNNIADPYNFVDVKSNVWAREGTGQPTNFLQSATQSKFGGGALLIKTATGSSPDYGIAASPVGGNYSLGTGNKFTLEGWLYWSGNIDSRPSVGAVVDDVGVTLAAIEFNTTNQIRFRTNLNGVLDDRTANPPLNQWVHLAVTYDGATKYWFVNGVLQGSTVLTAGAARTVATYRCRSTASGGSPPNAYIDDLRFTFDVCRYTATFTPPALAFPDQ